MFILSRCGGCRGCGAAVVVLGIGEGGGCSRWGFRGTLTFCFKSVYPDGAEVPVSRLPTAARLGVDRLLGHRRRVAGSAAVAGTQAGDAQRGGEGAGVGSRRSGPRGDGEGIFERNG